MFENLRQKELWQRNLYILSFGTFMTGVGASLVIPFLPLYIESLGHYSKAELSFHSGLIIASTYLTSAIASPLWGKLADRKGRRPMMLRASLGMGIIIFLMGFVTNVWQLLILRLLLGAFSGYISNSTALMAIIVPKDKAGKALGTLSAWSTAGMLLGPLIGGVLAVHTGYRMTFSITGVIMLLVFLLTWFYIKEEFTPKTKAEMTKNKVRLAEIPNIKIVIAMLVTMLVIQLSDKAITPILSLYVRELAKHPDNITVLAGLVASAPGLIMIFAAPFFGRLGDAIGQYRVLFYGLLLAFVLYILLAFTNAIWQLLLLRLLVGISDAALEPSAQIIMAKYAPEEYKGRIFSYGQSMRSVGAVGGPIAGSAVAGYFDYRYVFFLAAFFIILNLINFGANYKVLKTERTK
ncbi:MAG: MFS transporter [Micrococcaceae bacterium]